MEKETPVTLIHAPFLNRFARHFRVLAYLTAFLTVLLTAAPAYPMGSNEPGVRVSNVRAEVSGLRVTVRYDLAGSPHRRYNVALVLRNRDNPSFRYFPKTLSGDVGAGEYAGRDKVIEWDMSREFPQGLQRNGYFFVVVAEQAGGSSHRTIYLDRCRSNCCCGGRSLSDSSAERRPHFSRVLSQSTGEAVIVDPNGAKCRSRTPKRNLNYDLRLQLCKGSEYSSGLSESNPARSR